jgi:hypothetical protein
MLVEINKLHVRATNVFFTTIFRVGLLPYLKLVTIGMKRNTLFEHKEVTVLCEENIPITLKYNALLTTPKASTMVKPIVPVVITKST